MLNEVWRNDRGVVGGDTSLYWDGRRAIIQYREGADGGEDRREIHPTISDAIYSMVANRIVLETTEWEYNDLISLLPEEEQKNVLSYEEQLVKDDPYFYEDYPEEEKYPVF